MVNIQAPFTPEKYVEAIQLCEKSSIEVIIIDSISHEWEGLLEVLNNMTGNSYTNWNKLTPRHNFFIQHILQSPLHVIGTIRSKQDYVLSEKNGKMVPEKIGMKGITRENLDYEFMLVFEIDMKHHCTATKDRTSLFVDKPCFIITPEVGQKILAWCNQPPADNLPSETRALNEKPVDKVMLHRINSCTTIDELLLLYKSNPSIQISMLAEFTRKRQLLTVKTDLKTITKSKFSQNGTATNQ